MTDAPAEALANCWNIWMAQAIDMIAAKHPLLLYGAHLAPWYTPELRQGNKLEDGLNVSGGKL